jgi:mRNA-degrading endonuclease YafQ of YafQ-DinJ toxin-antitoxin module
MSPTYGLSPGFAREFARMSREQRRAFRIAVEKLIEALRGGADLPHSLRIKRVQGTKDVWEMSYSGDGRATFRYGSQVKPGEMHVEWLRVGGHEILSRPQ